MRNLNEQALALRESGRTLRYHCNILSHRQNVAEHSWNMAMLLRVLNPGARPELLWAILTHDVPERWVGDVPAPAKWWMGIGESLNLLEADVLKKLGLNFSLDVEELEWLRGLDWLEAYMFVCDEIASGNQHIAHIKGVYERMFSENKTPLPILNFVQEFEWRRTMDVL